jgi:ACS family glucarate transporter-like MFS transporter
MVPLLCGAASNWGAGFTVDRLYRSRHRAWSRRLPAMAGFLLGTCGVLTVALSSTSGAAVAGFAIAIFGVEMTISPSWAYCMDIGGRSSGSLGGAMNMSGNIGAVVSANAFPYLQRLTGSAAAYFVLAALLNLGGVICWTRMKPREGES